MRNLFLLLIAFTITGITVNAQTEPDWTRVLQATSYAFPAGRVVAADGDNVYLAAYFSGPITFNNTIYNSIGQTDLFLTKLSSSGTVAWVKQIDGMEHGNVKPEAMQVDANHNIYVVGAFAGTISSGSSSIASDATNNAFIAKLDADGNVLWLSAYAASGTGSSKIVFDDSGNSYLNNKSKALLKFNSSGVKEWEQNYPDRTLHAIGVFGPHLFIGGALQSGTTTFGKFDLACANAYNTGFMARADLDGIYNNTLIAGNSNSTKEGSYHAVGTLIHPTTGTRTFDLTKTVTGTEENVLSTSVGDLSATSGTLILSINPDNTVSISGAYSTYPVTQSGVNKYDPVTKAFTLNYSYTVGTGTRLISEVLTQSSTYNAGDGSSIADFAIDNAGTILVTGAYTKVLKLDTITTTNPSASHYTYIAKCDSNFVFAWVKSSDAIALTREMYAYRLFQDNSNNIYEYGISNYGATTFNFGSISVPQQSQFLFKFDENGVAVNGYGFQYTSVNRTVVTPNGKIIATLPVLQDEIAQTGNFKLIQYNNNLSADWDIGSSNHQAGNNYINYVKHDNLGNTYVQAYVQGFSNFFGTVINSNQGSTVNFKLDKSGNTLWVDQINDLLPNAVIYGPKFTLDKGNNLLTSGRFNTTVKVGLQDFTNSDTFDDSYIVKYSSTGEVLWAIQLATEGNHCIYGIATDKTGNVIVSGEFKNLLSVGNKTIDAGTSDGVFIIKLDAAGNCLWASGYPVADVVYSAMVSTDAEDNIYLAGEMYNSTTSQLVFGTATAAQTNNDAGTVLVKINPDGTPLWAFTYGGVAGNSSIADGWPVDIKTDSAGNSYLYGSCKNNATFGSTTLTNPIGNAFSFYLTKINSDGGVVWADAVYKNTFSYNYGDWLDLDKKGNIYAGGYINGNYVIQGIAHQSVGQYDIFVTKYNNDGAIQWLKTLPNNQGDNTGSLSVFDDDILSISVNWATALTLQNFDPPYKGYLTAIIATLGVLESSPNTLFVDASDGSKTTFSFISNSNWIATSNQQWLTISSNSGTGDGLLTFTASENTTGEARTAIVTITFLNTKAPSITLTIIQDANTTGIKDMKKNQNLVYPNPATNSLYLNSEVQDALIYIYDSKGKMVVNKQVNTSDVNIGSLRNGIYTIRIASKSGIKTQKFIKQ